MFDPYHKWLGIPPEDQPPTYYRLLGVNLFESDADVIANAAEQRMTHVKRFEAGRYSARSQDLLNQLAQAKICLLNSLKKEEYDSHLRRQKPRPGIQVAGRVWRLRNPDWASLWESDRFWQVLSAGTLVLMLVVGLTVLSRARATPVAQRSASPMRPMTNGVRPLPPQPVAVSSSVSAPTGEKDGLSLVPPDERTMSQTLELPALSRPELPPNQPEPTRPTVKAVPPAKPSEPQQASALKRQHQGTRAAEPPSKPVYLDDLKELMASIGSGQLGKHGETGYPAENGDYGSRGICRGQAPSHMLSLHPPDKGTAYASYTLTEEYRVFRASVGILEVDPSRSAQSSPGPFFMGEAFSPLTFKVVGNGAVLWQSRPIRKSGDWQQCNVNIQGIRLLELHVDCPGPKTFAWAAFVEPLLDK